MARQSRKMRDFLIEAYAARPTVAKDRVLEQDAVANESQRAMGHK